VTLHLRCTEFTLHQVAVNYSLTLRLHHNCRRYGWRGERGSRQNQLQHRRRRQDGFGGWNRNPWV